eukprot:3161153-Prymnesium_polylepis.1
MLHEETEGDSHHTLSTPQYRAALMEEWACGAIGQAETYDDAARIITMSVTKEHWHNALEIAMRVGCKQFLARPAVAELIDTWWRGGWAGSLVTIPPNFNWLAMCVYALCPVLSPYVWQHVEEHYDP